MASFEEKDERISHQRALLRVRQTAGQQPSNSQRVATRVATARRAPSPVVETQDFYGNHALEDDHEDEDDDCDIVVTPEPTRKTPRRRATASVSFSEPVETPQRPLQVQPPSPKPAVVDAPRGRNRLETRLAELQRDVANLSLRLRASSSTSQRALSLDDDDDQEITGTSLYSTDDSRLTQRIQRRVVENDHEAAPATPLRAKSPARTILKTSKMAPEPKRVPSKSPSRVSSRPKESERRQEAREEEEMELRIHREQQQDPQPRSTREMLRAVRELRVVAVERDQLRFELEQTRKALVMMEKKLADAVKWKAAYDKMKAHCDSLQESLDLSEKIRVRQKKLLQQLQQSLKHGEDAASRTSQVAGKTAQRVNVLDSVLNPSSRDRAGYQPQPQPQQAKRRVHGGDMDSSRTRTTRATPTRGVSSTRPAAATVMNTSVSRSFSKSDFDSLLQIPLRDRSMAASTLHQPRTTTRLNDSRLPAASTRPAKTSATQPAVSRISKSKPPTVPRTNHFLAPTQASLSHAAKRKPDTIRRPFVV